MTTRDLRAVSSRESSAPTSVSYRGLRIDSTPPPSSGGSTVGEALNILSGYRLSTEPRATALFHYLEASRLAYADRDRYVGDPRYVHVPVRRLLSRSFAATRRCLVGNRALKSPVAPGKLSGGSRACVRPVASGGHQRLTRAPPHEQHRRGRQAGRHRRLHEHDQLLRRQRRDRARLRLPAQRRADRLRLRPDQEQRARSESAGRRQAAAVEHRADDRAVSRASGVRGRRGRRFDDPDDDPAVDRQPLDFGMSLPAALAAPRVSQTNGRHVAGRAGVYAQSGSLRMLRRRFGERFRRRPVRCCRSTITRATRPHCRCSAPVACRRSPSRCGCSAARRWSCTGRVSGRATGGPGRRFQLPRGTSR